MWGFYNSRDRYLANKIFSTMIDPNISKAFKKAKSDQPFLAKYVYPLISNNSIMHDSYFCEKYGAKPFPSKRIGSCFIGIHFTTLFFYSQFKHLC